MTGTVWNWSPAIDALNNAIQSYGQRQMYQSSLQGLFGSQAPSGVDQQGAQASFRAPQMQMPHGIPGGVQAQQPQSPPLSLQGPNIPALQGQGMTGPMGGMPGADAMYQFLRSAPPSMGYPLLMQTMEKQQERQQNIADRAITPLSAQEAQAANLPPGVWGRDVSGNVVQIAKSDMKSQGAIDQDEALARFKNGLPVTPEEAVQNKTASDRLAIERAAAEEKQREFNLTNPLTAGGQGGGTPDLSSYAPGTQAMVHAMLDGRQAPPSGMALKTPYWQQLMTLANSADPTFDQTAWGARASARKDFLGGGKSYQTLNAGNTAIQHLGHLYDQIGDVSGAQVPLIGNALNYGVNAFNQASGTPGVNAYNDTLGHLSEETTKFYRGTGGNEADVSRNMGSLSPNLSSAQKQAGVGNTVDLIYGKLAPMVQQYNKTMGTNYPTSHFLSTQAVSTIKRMGYDPDTGEKVAPSQAATPSAQAIVDELRKRGAVK